MPSSLQSQVSSAFGAPRINMPKASVYKASSQDVSDYLNSLGYSPDNPNTAKVSQLIDQLTKAGVDPASIKGDIRDLTPGASRSFIGANDNAKIQEAALGPKTAQLLQSLKQAQDQSATWESQNAGTSAAQRGLYDQQVKTATTFNNNIPKLAYTLGEQAAENQKTVLASQIDQTTQNYNSRGMLYSTAYQGAKANAQQQSAGEVAKEQSDINQKLAQTGSALTQAATNTGIALAGQNQQMTAGNTNLAGQYDQIAEQNAALQNQAIGSAISGIGSVAGGVLGSINTKGSSTNTTPSSQPIGQWAGSDTTGLGSGRMMA